MNIKTIIKLLEINNNIDMIGSNANKISKYSTDYDLQEYIKITSVTDYNKYLKKFQEIFNIVKKSNYMFITDMKAGTFNTLPIRWKYADIMNGFQDLDIKHVNFIDAIQQSAKNNTIKIDLIAFIDNEFIEFSCNYYFTINNKDIDDILLSLMLDVKKYYHERRFMKMLKRLMSYRLIKDEKIDDLTHFFNSNIGGFYQLYHQIDVFIFITDKYYNEINKITTGIKPSQFKKYNKLAFDKILKNIHKYKINISINKNHINQLEIIKETLNKKINLIVSEFLNK